MPKKMAFERKLNRDARKMPPPGDYGDIPPEEIPHEMVTDPPSGAITADMAAGGLEVARGNSSAMPLTPEGHATAQKTGRALANLGGVDQIVASDANRTMQTAHELQGADPNQPPITPTPNLESQALGNLEGENKSPAVKKLLADLVRKYPDFRVPGQGAMSSKQGESFNEFRVRALSAIRGLMQMLAEHPDQAIAAVKHNTVSRLLKSWLAAGLPDDLSIDHKEMLKEDTPKPGSVERFHPDASGKWNLEPFEPQSAKDLPKGSIYFVEHGETPSIAARSATVSAGQKGRSNIIAAIRSGDWKGAQKHARKASAAGLSDNEISSAIDEALPNPDDAAGLPPHQLLPVVSAAGPEKRAQLMPVLRSKFGDLSGVSPDAAQELRSHLGRLGAA